MPWSGLNRADKTLLFAATLFVFSLYLHLSFPENFFAQGILFCAEAALVGGIADWFAVTALFEKPMGFPWHTALLPKRREEFIAATTKLVQREFFSRRELFALTDQYDWKGILFRWLENDVIQAEIAIALSSAIKNAVQNIDTEEKAKEIAEWIRHCVLSVQLSSVLGGASLWLRKDDNNRQIFGTAIAYFRSIVEHPDTRDRLISLFEHMREEKLAGAGFLMNLLSGLASAVDVVNFDDLAECTQQEALRVLDDAAREDSNLGQRLRKVFYECLEATGKDACAQEAFSALRGEVLRAVPLEEIIGTGLCNIISALRCNLPIYDSSDFKNTMDELTTNEISRWFALLHTDGTVGAALDDLIKDVVRRNALEAQILSTVIIHEVLRNMTDEKLNAIVYGKVEPDLLWIRMNGSIVGATVGFVLFLLMMMIKEFL